jgi:hypothetical protein
MIADGLIVIISRLFLPTKCHDIAGYRALELELKSNDSIRGRKLRN